MESTERKAYVTFCNLYQWARNIDTAPSDELNAKRRIAITLCDYTHNMPGKHNRLRYKAVQAIRKAITAQLAVRSL